MEADFAQLEFRVAAFLAQDEKAMKEISTGFDVHSYTAKVITDAGQKTSTGPRRRHIHLPPSSELQGMEDPRLKPLTTNILLRSMRVLLHGIKS